MKLTISVKNTLFFLVLINPILSLLLDSSSIPYFYFFGPTVVLLLFWELGKKFNGLVLSLCVILVSLISALYSINNGGDIGKINNHFFNYISTVLLFYLFSKSYYIDYFKLMVKNNLFFLKLNIILINLTELFLLITKRGYTYRFSWGGTFFHGTNSMPHTLSYLMLVVILMVLLIITIENKKIYSVFSIIPLYAIFESGSRTSLILAFLLIIVLIDQIATKNVRSIIVKVFIALIILLFFLLIFRNKIINSDFWNKMVLRSNSGNSSAGRTYIWKDLLSRYIHESDTLQYLIGQGDDKSYYFNQVNPLVKSPVWAHNDFVQIIIGKGLFGLSIYVYTLVRFSLSVLSKNKNAIIYLVIMMIIFAALLNGFYSYKDIIMSIPYIAIICQNYDSGSKQV